MNDHQLYTCYNYGSTGQQVHKMHIVIAKYVTTYGFKVQVNLNIYCTNQPKVCKLCSE